jgi:virginiamycin B lyase
MVGNVKCLNEFLCGSWPWIPRTRWLIALVLSTSAILSPQTVTITAHTASGGPAGITTGPDGALWFTENAGNKIGRMTTNGMFTEYEVPTPSSGVDSISMGPDGALWFTEHPRNNIGRITPNGVFTEYVIPTAASGPAGITAGPDGALWFTESVASKIGRITTDGAITEYTIPTLNACWPSSHHDGPGWRAVVH